MGPEIAAVVVPALIAAGGTALQYSAQKDADKSRQKSINDMMAYQGAQSQKIVGDIEAEAPRYTQENIQNETQQVQEASQERLVKDLETALAPTSRNVPTGKVSSDYLTKRAEREGAEAARGAELARLFSAIDAPNQVRLKQSLDSADARARRAAIAGGTNATLSQMGNQYNSIQPDPFKTTAGGLAIGGAQAYSNISANDRIKKALQGTGGPTIFVPPGN